MKLKSLLLKPVTKAKIENNWPNLSPTAQSLILGLVAESQEYETKAVKLATQKNPHFTEAFRHRLAKSQSDSLKRIEEKDETNKEQDLLQALAEI